MATGNLEVNYRSNHIKGSLKKVKEKCAPALKSGLVFSALVNLTMLIIGCINIRKCPVNENIPIFLVASGAIGLVSKFVSLLRDIMIKYFRVSYLESMLYFVELIFFFLGTYWVYKEFEPSYDPSDGRRYCNKTVYLFSFIYITITYVIMLALIFGFCCFVCCGILLLTCSLASEGNEPDVEYHNPNNANEQTKIDSV